MLIRPPPQIIRPQGVPGGRVAGQGFGFPLSPPHAPPIVDTGGGGGGDWILASGNWDNSGVWDDASVWKDAA